MFSCLSSLSIPKILLPYQVGNPNPPTTHPRPHSLVTQSHSQNIIIMISQIVQIQNLQPPIPSHHSSHSISIFRTAKRGISTSARLKLHPITQSQLIGRDYKMIELFYLQKKMENKQQLRLETFLKKQQPSLTKEVLSTPIHDIKAVILAEDQLQEAASRLQHGGLVAFPTETVYGLGANAYDAQALKKIYEAKRRPLTDPIIVHVLDTTQAEKLVIMNEKQRILFELLTKQFWPGPLTIILKANLDLLPMMVTAQTGFVGVRAPRHPYARKLIEASNLPIGAPSANLFSHVSPTEPVHVFNDFYNSEIAIVEGGRCEYGVQSTVLKLLEDEIQVFREGSLSIAKLQNYLKQIMNPLDLPAVNVLRRVEGKGTNMQAPGQLLKHYAPYLPCYYYTGDGSARELETNTHQKFTLAEAAFISFDQKRYGGVKDRCKYYFEVGSCLAEQEESENSELFCSKEERLQMREIYYLLRRCENLNASAIVVGWSGAREGTVWDKVYRSTQGVQAKNVQ